MPNMFPSLNDSITFEFECQMRLTQSAVISRSGRSDDVLPPQHWEAFQHITEIFILVPALLGLKGNLEMTLASRLSTAVRQTDT